MKKKKLLTFKVLFFIALGLCVCALLAFMIISNMDIDVNYTYRYLNGEIVKSSWLDMFKKATYIYAGIVAVLMIFVIIFVFDAYKKKQEKLWLNLIVSIISIPIMIGIIVGGGSLVTGIMVDYETNYYLLSPKEYPVIICEKYREGECLGEVYQLMDNGDAYLLGKFSTENGYRNSEAYAFEEIDGGIKVYFAYNQDGLRGYIESNWN